MNKTILAVLWRVHKKVIKTRTNANIIYTLTTAQLTLFLNKIILESNVTHSYTGTRYEWRYYTGFVYEWILWAVLICFRRSRGLIWITLASSKICEPHLFTQPAIICVVSVSHFLTFCWAPESVRSKPSWNAFSP